MKFHKNSGIQENPGWCVIKKWVLFNLTFEVFVMCPHSPDVKKPEEGEANNGEWKPEWHNIYKEHLMLTVIHQIHSCITAVQ